jgi:hypothetical protein
VKLLFVLLPAAGAHCDAWFRYTKKPAHIKVGSSIHVFLFSPERRVGVMKICRVAFVVTLGVCGAGALMAQQSATVLIASGAPSESLFPGMPEHGMLLESLGPVAAAGNTSPVSNPEDAPVAPGPLTGKQRLILFWNDTYASPGAYAGVGMGAMIDQVEHTPAKWDGDGSGYTRRFASEWGQMAIRNAVHEGLAGATGLDPRYLQCNCKGVLHRSAHALKMSVTTYREDGRLTLDVPQMAGAYGSGILSTYWYPHTRYNPLVQGVQFGHEQMGEIALNNLVQEFGADIKRALHVPTWTARARSYPDDDE